MRRDDYLQDLHSNPAFLKTMIAYLNDRREAVQNQCDCTAREALVDDKVKVRALALLGAVRELSNVIADLTKELSTA